MNDAYFFVFFRRMRTPLIVLISAYSIATVGFTLMPGVDDQGNDWRMSLFEAFYVVSFTGSTIGFGEVPHEFSAAQRLWTIVSIYLTVFAWLFSIGSIISVLQDPAFSGALRRARLKRSVRSINEPFYLVCGYGDTGRMLTRELNHQHYRVVVIDHNSEKIDRLSVEDFGVAVPAFRADARVPDDLVAAGLRSRWCLGVLAVTGDERTNLKIAIAAKLLNHNAVVHARADTPEVADNMRSFDTDHVINPTAEYVLRMRLALERPDVFRLYQWLASGPGVRIPEVRQPPTGPWILCGFGRLGRAIHRMLVDIGMPVTVIEENLNLDGLPADAVVGRGTQADTLKDAGIDSAVGILATTRDDVDNLSILMTARQLNKDLFCAALENGLSSHALFVAARPDFIGQPSRVVAGSMLIRTRTALVAPFMAQLLAGEESLSRTLLERLSAHESPWPPELNAIRISVNRAPAIAHALEQGRSVPVSALLKDPGQRIRRLPLEVLMLRRNDQDLMLPNEDLDLELGDRLLVAGRAGAARKVGASLSSAQALEYILTGNDLHEGLIWRWMHRRFGRL